MLYRLLHSLEDFFQLRLEVPKDEERLIWSLNRFLAQAAKKNAIARIVIVIDGVNMIRGKDNPEGALHWLPTHLPPGVRFLISTVEYDTYETRGRGNTAYSSDIRVHRTFAELKRRNCPFERIEPLTQEVMQGIIAAYIDRCPNLELSEEQQDQILKCHHTAQPLYLRILLYALTLSLEMGYNVDDQLETYLQCLTSTALTSKMLDFYSEQIDDNDHSTMTIPKKTKKTAAARVGFLGSVLSVLYVSRHGLKDGEIWGAVELATQSDLPPETREKAHHLIKDFTMIVGGFRSFSHEEIKRVVYHKYIQTPEANIRLHMLMARYFAHFPANDRKVDCLPYHLEVSGSWAKLKNCLVDIEMFSIFWTARFRQEFIDLWGSLSNRVEPQAYFNKLVTGEFDETMRVNQPPRPYYDLVEEYAKSVEDYRDKKKPSDENISKICLQIAEFLLEFATRGHEERADVPAFLHPPVPTEDYKSMGVQYLRQEEDGRSILFTPCLEEFKGIDDGKQAPEIMPKPNEDFPTVSTYFYQRWMWIQFPLVALANCRQNYFIGIDFATKKRNFFNMGGSALAQTKVKPKKGGMFSDDRGPLMSKTLPTYMRSKSKESVTSSVKGGQQSWSFTRLPELKHIMNKDPRAKAAKKNPLRSQSAEGKYGNNEAENSEMYGAFEKALGQLREEISAMRAQYDAMVNHRPILEKKYSELNDEFNFLSQLDTTNLEKEQKRKKLCNRGENLEKKHNFERTVGKNYKKILLMCERHPAYSGALIKELEQKLKLYERLVTEIRERFRADTYERQAYQVSYRQMREAINETVALHHEMLSQRLQQHSNLKKANAAEIKLKESKAKVDDSSFGSAVHSLEEGDLDQVGSVGPHRGGGESPRTVGTAASRGPEGEATKKLTLTYYRDALDRLTQKTGIADVNLFIQKFANCDQLERQMSSLKAGIERRKEELMREVEGMEKELDLVRFTAGAQAGSKEIRDRDRDLNEAINNLKHTQERAETANTLKRSLMSGLKHICSILGIEESQTAETSPQNLIYSIETVLDAISDEKDKNLQKGETTGPMSPQTLNSTMSFHELTTQTSLDLTRPKEVEAALTQYETPKTRLAARLPARPMDNSDLAGRFSKVIESRDPATEDKEDDSDEDESGNVPDRKMVKLKSRSTLKTEQKRMARMKPNETI